MSFLATLMTRVNVLGEGAIFWNLELREALFQTPKGFSSSSLTFDWLFLTALLSSFMCTHDTHVYSSDDAWDWETGRKICFGLSEHYFQQCEESFESSWRTQNAQAGFIAI